MLDDLFPKKLRLGDPPKPKGKQSQSLLTMKIQTSPKPKENPFTDFSPYDAHDRPPSESMTVRVLLTALQEFQEPEIEDPDDKPLTMKEYKKLIASQKVEPKPLEPKPKKPRKKYEKKPKAPIPTIAKEPECLWA